MKNTFFIFLAFCLLISNIVIGQKEVRIEPLNLHGSYKAPYIADDGSFAIMEIGYVSNRYQLHTFDKDGNMIAKVPFKYKKEILFAFFDPTNKCFLRAGIKGKKMFFIQMNFDGTSHESSVDYKNAKKGFYFERMTINTSGNIEIYFAKGNNICSVEYNPKNYSAIVQYFNIFPGSFWTTAVTDLGKIDEETYFVSRSRESNDSKVSVVAVNGKYEKRIVTDLEFPFKENHMLLNTVTRLDPYIDGKPNESLAFLLYFTVFEGDEPKPIQNRESGRPFYKICRVAKSGEFSVLDFDPKNQREMNGEYNLYFDEDIENETCSLIFVNKDFSVSDFKINFENPSEELEGENFPAYKISDLALREKEFNDLYQAAKNCYRGTFKICDDGVARVVYLEGEKVMMHESKVPQ